MNNNFSLSHRKQEPESGVLYVVGTPIGNLDDISLRAINILKKVSLIACEDTRKTGRLLKHLTISNKLICFNEHNSDRKIDYLISKLQNGLSLAIVSDAGMPLISDPGGILVKNIIDNDLEVVCVPGPCAAITALVSSGIDASQFTFYGFIPKSKKARNAILKTISESKMTSIIYESPNRILKLLYDLKSICGEERNLVLIKELTKRFETHYGGNINSVIEQIEKNTPKGEFTLVISGCKKENKIKENDNKILLEDFNNLIKAGLTHSAATNYLSQKLDRPKNEIYKLSIQNSLR